MPSTNSSPTSDSVRITINRSTTGVQFQLFAPMFDRFFAQLSSTGSTSRPRTTSDVYFGAQQLYQLPQSAQDSLLIPGVFYELGTGRLLNPEGDVNLAILTAVGSGEGEGVTFTVRTVLNRSQQRMLTEGLKRAIVSLYPEFMQPEVNVIEFNISQLTR